MLDWIKSVIFPHSIEHNMRRWKSKAMVLYWLIERQKCTGTGTGNCPCNNCANTRFAREVINYRRDPLV
jgi:hypothetical protein